MFFLPISRQADLHLRITHSAVNAHIGGSSDIKKPITEKFSQLLKCWFNKWVWVTRISEEMSV